jgi:hypothetical protein
MTVFSASKSFESVDQRLTGTTTMAEDKRRSVRNAVILCIERTMSKGSTLICPGERTLAIWTIVPVLKP